MNRSPSTPTDGELIAAILAGDNHPFALLVRRYERELLRVAYSRLGRVEWAEDAVQETFLSVFRFLRSYDSRYSFRTWIWTILLNHCRGHLKKRSRRVLVRSWSDHTADVGPCDIASQLSNDESPTEKLIASERSEVLDTLLRRLPEPQADALRLRFYGGLKFHEIADAMQCSLSTAKNRVRWGLAKMADFLQPERAGERGPESESRHDEPHEV